MRCPESCVDDYVSELAMVVGAASFHQSGWWREVVNAADANPSLGLVYLYLCFAFFYFINNMFSYMKYYPKMV
jgi:hypothetical protein